MTARLAGKAGREVRGQRSGICKRIKPAVYFLLLTSYSLLLNAGCTEKDSMYRDSRILMDTFCAITVVSPSKERAREAIDAGFDEIRKLETLLNYFSPDSELSGINRAAGISAVRVSKETAEILAKTIGISGATGGAFDPSVAPVIKLWKFSKGTSGNAVPSDDIIKEALRHIDYRKIVINDAQEVFLPEKGMEMDLGGIAKGYAADKAVDAIRKKGISAALVAIAGDIRGYGVHPSGSGWKVGIQNPRPAEASEKPWEDVFAVLYLRDRAISTSGDYQRFFMQDGKRYHHLLDPKTGYPADSGLMSVSVIAPEGYLADSLSTAVFILGAEKGLKLLESRGLDGVMVDENKNVFITDGLKGQIEIMNNEYRIQPYDAE